MSESESESGFVRWVWLGVLGRGEEEEEGDSFESSKRPILSSSHSTRCFRLAIVESSFSGGSSQGGPVLESEVSRVMVLGATPHSSWEGRGRGVPGEEVVWKEGGGEVGMLGAMEEDEEMEVGRPVLKL